MEKGTIAGFGSLSAEEYAHYVAARTLGGEHGAGTELTKASLPRFRR